MAILVLALSLAVAVAVSHADTRVVLSERRREPSTWVRGGRPSPDTLIELTFFLKTPAASAAALEAELLDRSDPASARYGQWLSSAHVQALAAPSPEAAAGVAAFLADFLAPSSASPSSMAAVVERSPHGSAMSVTVTMSAAEALLEATYHSYTHQSATQSSPVTRCLAYSLPAAIAAHVAMVVPTTHFPAPSRAAFTPHSASGLRQQEQQQQKQRHRAADLYTNDPANLRALYGVNATLGGKGAGNRQAATAFLGQLVSVSDWHAFFAAYLPEAAATPLGFVGDATTAADDDGSTAAPGLEAMLDAEYLPAMGALVATEVWGFSGSSPNDAEDEPFLSWLLAVGNASDATVPLVFSTSYGEDEDSEVPTDYSDRVNVEFMKCGLRGISLLFSSGDSGAAGRDGTCGSTTLSGAHVDGGGASGSGSGSGSGGAASSFVPMWPASSPFVTAVGGTEGGRLPEACWPRSSGGFSNAFSQPAWQAKAVEGFLAAAASDGTLPPRASFNASGRGFPDVSAQAVGFPVVCGGSVYGSVDGTSCSAPTFSGVVGLLNDARLAAGKASLGFLNPLLYASPAALRDCDQGVQQGCPNPTGGLPGAGFPAIGGWDPVTGLGSPNFPALLAVVMALP